MTDIPLREIAEAICKSHLSMYADPAELQEEGANQYGIVVEFSPSQLKIRFSFVFAEIPGAWVSIGLDAEAFVLAPKLSVAKLHVSLDAKMAEYYESRHTIIVRSPSALPEPTPLVSAMNEVLH